MTTLDITYTGILIAVTCPTCHVAHGIPSDLRGRMLESRGPFGQQVYCPNGHAWHYTGETAADKLRAQLDASKRDADWQRKCRQRSEEREQVTSNRLRATRGVVTRIKRRVKGGVCPCCNRTFTALAAHMQTKHPDYASSTDL